MMVKSSHITAKEIWFAKPRQVEVRKSQIRSPEPGEVIVSTQYSAVSAGSELLVYRGEAPNDIPLDSTIESLQSDLEYPLRYGYSCVGEVIEVHPSGAAEAVLGADDLDGSLFLRDQAAHGLEDGQHPEV